MGCYCRDSVRRKSLVLVSEEGCKKFQIYIERPPHTANNKLEGVQRTIVTSEY